MSGRRSQANQDEPAAAVPDEPRWVAARSILLHGTGQMFSSPDANGCILVSTVEPLACMVGRPDAQALREADRAMPSQIEMLVMTEDLEHARRLLAGWNEHPVTIHTLQQPIDPDASPPADSSNENVLIVEPADDAACQQLPPQLQLAVRGSFLFAATRSHDATVGGAFVSVCGACAVTESWWDVSVATLPDHRRRGYARACYCALAGVLARRGRQPVWGATNVNTASLGMARALGFAPVDRLSIFMRPGQPTPDPTAEKRAASRSLAQ